MPAVAFGDAAAYCGHKSRSTLYRLQKRGSLNEYLRPGGKGGAQLLELEPEGLPTLREHVAAVVRMQANSPSARAAEAQARQQQRDGSRKRWAVVAVTLCEALAASGSTATLTPQDAQTLAGALPEALADGWGADALQALAADALQLAEQLRPAPTLEQHTAGQGMGHEWWAEWGRIAGPDEPPLSDDEAEDHAAAMVAGLLGHPLPKVSPRCWLWDVESMAADARADVAAGARWDQGRWDAANVRHLLPDAGDCELARAELRELLAAGRVPAELLAEAEAALAQEVEA